MAFWRMIPVLIGLFACSGNASVSDSGGNPNSDNGLTSDESLQTDTGPEIPSITFDATVTGRVDGPAGIPDAWYEVLVTKDGFLSAALEIATTQPDGYSTISVSIFDSDRISELAHAETTIGGANGTARTWFDMRPGTYYVRVSTLLYSWSSANRGASDYDLTVKFEPISVELDPEPDDRFEEANDLVLSEAGTGHATGGIGFFGSGKNDDDDWYRVTIDSDGFLSLMLELDHDCGDGYGIVSASLYDADGITELEYCETHSAGPNGQVRTLRDLRPGVYYLRVSTLIHSWSRVNRGASGYILTSGFVPVTVAPDTEPNDRFETATAVELDHQGAATVTGGIGFWGSGVNDNDDWYSIVIPTDTFVTIGLELESSQNDGHGTLSVSWYDTDGVSELVNAATIVAGPNGASQGTTDVRPGTYFFRVSSLIHSWSSANRGASGYTVRVSTDPISWQQDPEPNDRFEQAVALQWSEPEGVHATGGIGFFGSSSNDDDDWYRLELPRGGDLMATLELDSGQPNGNYFISVSIYGSDGTTEAGHAETYEPGPNHLAVTTAGVSTGTAYLRVSTFLHSYSHSSLGASGYNLTAKIQ